MAATARATGQPLPYLVSEFALLVASVLFLLLSSIGCPGLLLAIGSVVGSVAAAAFQAAISFHYAC